MFGIATSGVKIAICQCPVPLPSAPSDTNGLIKILNTGSATERIYAARTLGTRRENSDEVIASLALNLSHENASVRQEVIRALGNIGLSAQETREQLTTVLLRDEFAGVRSEAARALGRIGDRASVPYLAQSLQDENVVVRISAAEAIETLTGEIFEFRTESTGSSTLSDLPTKVPAAIEWWESKGQYMNWATVPTPTATVSHSQ